MATKKKEEAVNKTAEKAETSPATKDNSKAKKPKAPDLKYEKYLQHVKSQNLYSVGDKRSDGAHFHYTTAENYATKNKENYKLLTKAQVLKLIEKGKVENPDA